MSCRLSAEQSSVSCTGLGSLSMVPARKSLGQRLRRCEIFRRMWGYIHLLCGWSGASNERGHCVAPSDGVLPVPHGGSPGARALGPVVTQAVVMAELRLARATNPCARQGVSLRLLDEVHKQAESRSINGSVGCRQHDHPDASIPVETDPAAEPPGASVMPGN